MTYTNYKRDTHCKRGHDLRSPGAVTINYVGWRHCTACRQDRDREWKRRRASKARKRKP